MAITGDINSRQLVTVAADGNFPVLFQKSTVAPESLMDKDHWINDYRISGKKAGGVILVILSTVSGATSTVVPAATSAKLYVAAGPEPTDKWHLVDLEAGVVPA